MNRKIPLFKIYWDEEDISAVTNVIKRGGFWATGPEIKEFEKKLLEFFGEKYAVVFNSGTSALHSILLAYGIKKGSEIVVPSFSFIATANAPLFVGAKPVFADIEKETFGLDSEDVKEKITPKTKAIIPIHYGGCPCKKIKELKEIAEENNLLLIEDAAESFGAKIKNEKVGTFGNSAMFSFCQNKVFTTGEGASIVTNSKEIYEKLKLIRSHGRLETGDYFSSSNYMDYITLGYNFRMSNISAALGISQIKKVEKIISLRRKNADYMTKSLAKIDEIFIPKPPKDFFHVYQMYTIRVKNGKRDALKEYLEKKGIMTKVYFDPIHKTRFYRKLGYKDKLTVTEMLSSEVLTLPMYAKMTIDEMNYIIEEIQNFFDFFG